MLIYNEFIMANLNKYMNILVISQFWFLVQ